jgi:acetyl esterase/lipase
MVHQSCRRAAAILGLAAMLVLASSAGAGAAPGATAPRATHPAGSVLKGISYCKDGTSTLRLDLYYPTRIRYAPAPVLLWIHGGTWMFGSRSGAATDRQVALLRANGFAVAAIDYTLAPAYRFPHQIQDLTCGVRYLRANHRRLGLDPSRVGALGVSAGGHLAAMLGVDDGTSYFVNGGFSRFPSGVQAVVALYGVHDLTLRDLASYDEKALPDVFGPFWRWRAASPRAHVRAGLPPFLLVHGDHDTDVPVIQSRVMAKSLGRAGVAVRLIIVHNAGHGLVRTGGVMRPNRATIRQDVVDFFVHNLKLRAPA